MELARLERKVRGGRSGDGQVRIERGRLEMKLGGGEVETARGEVNCACWSEVFRVI